ncbi:MAG: DNA repair exonuclease, partial [Gemmatimonadetes bacterium]|nr:DNA repair exonuclease [Gemmatimonadota bacterium]
MNGRSETLVRTIVTGAYQPGSSVRGLSTWTSTRSGRLRLRKLNECTHIRARLSAPRSSSRSTGAFPMKKGTNFSRRVWRSPSASSFRTASMFWIACSFSGESAPGAGGLEDCSKSPSDVTAIRGGPRIGCRHRRHRGPPGGSALRTYEAEDYPTIGGAARRYLWVERDADPCMIAVRGSAAGCSARDPSLPGADQVRLLHIADVHLDSPFTGRSEAMRQRLRRAALEALDRCVTTALAEEVDALLIAGDLFDREYLSFETERFLLAQLGRLAEAGIEVVYATGNHDPGEGSRAEHLDWPGNVTVIPDGSPVVVPIAGPAGDTVGYVTGAGHATARETGDLSAGLTPVPDTDLPQAALLHTQVSSAGAGGVHHAYAPSSLANLRAAGFHYWALGHVHLRQELSGDPPVHYSGGLQGRGPGETGAKGGLLVDLEDPGHPVVEFREFAPVRWEKLSVRELNDARTLDDVVGAVTSAWSGAREADPGAEGTAWLLSAELVGPSPRWGQLRDQAER